MYTKSGNARARIYQNDISDRKLCDFDTRLSLFDTGTGAHLRQDDSLVCPLMPSSTVIHTAGPDRLKATQAGLLNRLVNDDKGNMHQIMLENALVLPGLSQNLTSHKQFVENGHVVFLHRNQAGIVLDKEAKFRSDVIIIPFDLSLCMETSLD